MSRGQFILLKYLITGIMNRGAAYFSSVVNVEAGEGDIVVLLAGKQWKIHGETRAGYIRTYIYFNFCLCIRGGTEQVVKPRIRCISYGGL